MIEIRQQGSYELPTTYATLNDRSSFYLGADFHLDNPKCNRNLLKLHLEAAKKAAAPIFVFGDLFCAMQGKYDKRGSKSDLMREHASSSYLDNLVDEATDFLKPFANNIAFISMGNHETAILARHETNLTKRLVDNLNYLQSPVVMGSYSGYIKFAFRRKDGSAVRSCNLFYHHGYGGDAVVTKGSIQTNRMAVYLPDADIVVSGHTHNKLYLPIARERLSATGELYIDEQHHIKLSTYKEEYLPHKGWHVERGAPPKPLGGGLLKLSPQARGVNITFEYL